MDRKEPWSQQYVVKSAEGFATGGGHAGKTRLIFFERVDGSGYDEEEVHLDTGKIVKYSAWTTSLTSAHFHFHLPYLQRRVRP